MNVMQSINKGRFMFAPEFLASVPFLLPTSSVGNNRLFRMRDL